MTSSDLMVEDEDVRLREPSAKPLWRVGFERKIARVDEKRSDS